MHFEFTDQARAELEHWKRRDQAKLKRIKQLLQAIEQDPFKGVGKPEALRFSLAGWWSRRIDQKHRLVYRVEGDTCTVLQCRFHYDR